jgi:hypothetical protein
LVACCQPRLLCNATSRNSQKKKKVTSPYLEYALGTKKSVTGHARQTGWNCRLCWLRYKGIFTIESCPVQQTDPPLCTWGLNEVVTIYIANNSTTSGHDFILFISNEITNHTTGTSFLAAISMPTPIIAFGSSDLTGLSNIAEGFSFEISPKSLDPSEVGDSR